jgi:hypothetical protein
LIILPFIVSCAGPYTPFGSKLSPLKLYKDFTHKEVEQELSIQNKVIGADISFLPHFQTLHESKDFVVTIKDPEMVNENSRVSFFYNNQDITFLIESISKRTQTKSEIKYKVNSLTLPPGEDHSFIVLYKRNISAEVVAKNYPFPKCDLYKEVKLALKEFNAKKDIKDTIELVASKNKINKALIAGLIAQESSFNPKAVSWAKAVGLTQVTPVAERQILNTISSWNVYPNWNRMPASILKSHIQSGKMNKENDWKLNPETSIEGGIKYIKYLEYFWSRPQNKEAIPLSLREKEKFTSILLASYNSGPSRVKRRLLSHGTNWLSTRDLKEAKKYIGKVKSYCNNFTIE